MKTLEEIKVSVYENVYSKKPTNMSFLEVISMCIHPVHAPVINTIRRYYAEGDFEAAQQIKSGLDCFTPAGTFDGAHAIKNFCVPSHIVGLDYDHVPNRLEVIQLCATDPHTVAAIESPTDGVKIFAYVEGIEGRHREGQQLVSNYYNKLLGLESDKACKDESRLCYFTYSPNGYVASLYQAFVLEDETPMQTDELIPDGNISEEAITQFISSYIFLHPLTAGQRHTNVFKLSCEACRRRYPQESILRELTTLFEHTDFGFEELQIVVSSGYKQVNENSGAPSATPSSCHQKDKKTKSHYGTIENSDDDAEAYWSGEEFRKETPLFPRDLYDNLPSLLEDCLLEDGSNREEDISFLANITALSAALPQTFGIYNHKKYSPHLFCVISSPAGSGKSVAQTGRYLLEEIQAEILATSESMLKNYRTAHSSWLAECQQKKKKREKCSEEPERPPFKMLLIPATTSYTRMQIQMQDNGAQGSIIFDTEAQTFSTANHLDCGNFDDMLRKAFEHENIDSSYKANGFCPVSIRSPKLALFLTGTPSQIDMLLREYERGLPSRILSYTFRETPCWKEMSDECTSLEDSFKLLAHRVAELYRFCDANPALFHFRRPQWERLNQTFSRMLADVAMEGNDDLQAVVKRHAFMVMRISMIQTRIRQFEAADLSPEIYCTDADFNRSLQIVSCCYEHSRLLHSAMPTPSVRPLKDPDTIHHFFNELPDSFITDEAMKIGAKYDFSSRKVARLLNKFNGLKISRISHGSYTKVDNR